MYRLTHSRSSKPIHDLSDLERIRKYLANRPRDLLFFNMIIMTGIPAKQLLKIKVSDLKNLKAGDRLILGGKWSQSESTLIMSSELLHTWRNYLSNLKPADEDYVFKSSRGNRQLNLSTMTNMVNRWFKDIGFEGVQGLRSLHSTWEKHFSRSKGSDRAEPHESFKPLKKLSAHEYVYRELLEAIISGTIPPGERLVAEKIAAQMRVSRMPIREAFMRLLASGFISMTEGGGIIVNKLSREDFEEIQKIRLILEREAAGQASILWEDIITKKLERNHDISEKLIASGKMEKAIKLNKDFHMTIYNQAKMPILSGIIEGLLDKVSPYLYFEFKKSNHADPHIQNTINNHGKIIDGLRERNPDKVKYWLTKDHNITTIRIIKFLNAPGSEDDRHG
jgi:DNA-binding GntR family transcriptional regulator